MTATAAMNIPLHYVPMRQPMKSEYLLSARRGDHPFPSRALDQKNYMLKRDLLPGLGALSIRSSSPVSARSESGSENNSPQKQSSVNSSRYKTELCRPFEEQGMCKYGDKCQFAHGVQELRTLVRHPKYKTELCRTYHTVGFCPYGPRCHFVHNEEDLRPAQSPKSPCKTSTSSAVSMEHVASSHAFRNLISNLDFYQTPVSQLSVSLGSAGEYSPTNSLSTSPVLSPVFSEDLSPPHQLLSPVWPVGHEYLPIPTPQQVPAEHFELSLRYAREEFLLQSSGGAGSSTTSSVQHSSTKPSYSTTSSDQYPSISSSTGHYRHGGTAAVSGAIHRTCRELATNHCHLDTTDRLPIFRRFSVEDQGYA